VNYTYIYIVIVSLLSSLVCVAVSLCCVGLLHPSLSFAGVPVRKATAGGAVLLGVAVPANGHAPWPRPEFHFKPLQIPFRCFVWGLEKTGLF
jgi:hypothetical protein